MICTFASSFEINDNILPYNNYQQHHVLYVYLTGKSLVIEHKILTRALPKGGALFFCP
jgi:hypothetical protein